MVRTAATNKRRAVSDDASVDEEPRLLQLFAKAEPQVCLDTK